MEGKLQPFYDNGLPRFKGEYLNSEMHGFWEFFRKDGSLMREGRLNLGMPEGEWVTHVRP